jgi:Tol biopolymer transport system component
MRHFAGIFAFVAVTCTVLLAAEPADATYRGKNARIEFSLDTGSGYQINTIRPNGKGLKQITSVTGSALSGDYSPDGTRIVFDIDPKGGVEGCGIFVMDAADGGSVVDLTPKVLTQPDACAYDPTFTPDGRRIVFLAQRCTACRLWISVMNLHGGGRRNIVHEPHRYGMHSPNVSPDGRTIVFLAERDAIVKGVQGNRKSLYTVRMNGTHMQKIVGFRFDVCNCGGDWAPNGSTIVSSDQAGPTPIPGKASNLFTIRPDGTGLRYVTHSRDASIYLSVGTYSPNGRWIMYKRVTAKGKSRLMKIHPSGRAATLIAKLLGDTRWRDWGPKAS